MEKPLSGPILPWGPPCPQCHINSNFMGIDESMYDENEVEVYECMTHGHRFEADLVVNKGKKD